MNVALGGSLHQHVCDLPGIAPHGDGAEHPVEMAGSSRTRDAMGAAPRVNSWHHQAVNRPGAGFAITARAPDGIIEGMESERHRWVVGVQWHPERIAERPEQSRLLAAFVAAGRRT